MRQPVANGRGLGAQRLAKNKGNAMVYYGNEHGEVYDRHIKRVFNGQEDGRLIRPNHGRNSKKRGV